ncbi:protease [Deinococcus piscis]|uniref:Protease n=1 Tax=Deinococcus piscis TaxID=394230 RepID=A0ABQ3JX57_9DEIO|nr:S41 family peptidase [Deinococcus piscis]GHF94083.1 protease [Deinococcus piscis]
MKALAQLLTGLLLLAPVAAAAPQTESDVSAQDLFDEVIYELALNYGGPSEVRAQDLRERFLPRVQALCAGESVCTSKAAYPVIGEVLRALNDEHTNFFTPAEWAAQELESSGQASAFAFGLVTRLVEGQGILVTEVLPGSPAAEAGLRSGDLLTRMGRMPLLSEWAGDKLGAAGRSGRRTTLSYSRAGQPLQTELAGGAFVAPAVSVDMLDGRTALVRLRHFDMEGVAQDLHDALRRAGKQGAERAVLDLRGNPGGLLPETLLSTGALTQPAPLLDVERSSSELLSYDRGRYLVDGEPQRGVRVFKPQRFAGPLAVLVDQDSASGAEFMARDLLTRPRTVVLGRPTVGVGDSATQLLDLADGSGLQVTVSRVQTADGQPLSARVQPQVPLKRDDAAFARTGQDPELAAALQALDTLKP